MTARGGVTRKPPHSGIPGAQRAGRGAEKAVGVLTGRPVRDVAGQGPPAPRERRRARRQPALSAPAFERLCAPCEPRARAGASRTLPARAPA
ncbi:hypothetical protein GCM10010389_23250 [Streptomyces echinoruber]|uniref:Uncharacterized protein n=1 Tax=Streptomyces echinoruber TaxID=68898 RepID=A0A918R3M4_9ACTN|nr:hypothetical protein GCM10010389_23250 [Streptomyces echinoruber]